MDSPEIVVGVFFLKLHIRNTKTITGGKRGCAFTNKDHIINNNNSVDVIIILKCRVQPAYNKLLHGLR